MDIDIRQHAIKNQDFLSQHEFLPLVGNVSVKSRMQFQNIVGGTEIQH